MIAKSIRKRFPLRSSRQLVWPVLAAAVVLLPGCSSDPPVRRPQPNIVIVTIDTLRADHLGTYGYFRDTSPEIDALAEESVVFERCLTPMSTTLPAHTSLFTATYPIEHGVLANVRQGGSRFLRSSGLVTLAEVARDLGYDTGGFVSAAPVKASTGIATGFDSFGEPGGARRRGSATMDEAFDWLDGRGDAPFLLWVHLFEPHRPYDAPEEYAAMFPPGPAHRAFLDERGIESECETSQGIPFSSWEDTSLYDAEVRAADDEIGRLVARLESLGVWDETVFVLTSDHGEGLCQQGDAGHGNVYDAQLHVPLLVRGPGIASKRDARLLSLVDVMPTVLELSGVSRDWEPLLRQSSGVDVLARPVSAEVEVFSQRTLRERSDFQGPAVALTNREWKLIREEVGPSRLFSHSEDPHELVNVIDENGDVSAAMSERLTTLMEAQRERASLFRKAGEPTADEIDADRLEELRSLGYVD